MVKKICFVLHTTVTQAWCEGWKGSRNSVSYTSNKRPALNQQDGQHLSRLREERPSHLCISCFTPQQREQKRKIRESTSHIQRTLGFTDTLFEAPQTRPWIFIFGRLPAVLSKSSTACKLSGNTIPSQTSRNNWFWKKIRIHIGISLCVTFNKIWVAAQTPSKATWCIMSLPQSYINWVHWVTSWLPEGEE